VADADAFDAGQWRALVLAGLRNDLRRSGRAAGLASSSKTRGFGTLIVLQFLVGGMLSIPLWVGMPAFPVAVLQLTYLMLSVAALLVLDAQALLLSPADYAVVAPRPVSGRTFFAARLATVLTYVYVFAGAQSLFPLVGYVAAGGLHPGRGALGLVAIAVTTLTTAAATTILYGLVLRHAAPRRLRAMLTALQLTTSFGLYGLLVLLPSRVGRAYLLDPVADRPAWLWAVPSTWAASLLDAGRSGWWLAPLALAIPIVALWSASRWFSIDHAEQVAATGTVPDATRGARVAPNFRTGEAQAVALLARAQFHNDMRFRLAVLSILPLTIIYLMLGVMDEDLARKSQGHPAMVYVALLLFPVLLKSAFARSDAYRAAWVFYAAPVSPGRLLLGQRTVLVRWFLGPYVVAIGLLLSYVLPSALDALVAVAVASLLSHALLLVVLLVDPTLPFSAPPQVGSNTRGILVAVIPAIFLGQMLPRALTRLSTSAVLAGGAVLLLVLLNVGMDYLLRWRVDRLASRVEFTA
jgi:hypothetical protein